MLALMAVVPETKSALLLPVKVTVSALVSPKEALPVMVKP